MKLINSFNLSLDTAAVMVAVDMAVIIRKFTKNLWRTLEPINKSQHEAFTQNISIDQSNENRKMKNFTPNFIYFP